MKCYKEAIADVLDGTFTEEKKDEWDEKLATVFNRGFWDGYYQGLEKGCSFLEDYTLNFAEDRTHPRRS